MASMNMDMTIAMTTITTTIIHMSTTIRMVTLIIMTTDTCIPIPVSMGMRGSISAPGRRVCMSRD
jgi:hypothetical protein